MTTPEYRIPSTEHRVEEVIRRSRFITTAAYAPTTGDAHAFIARIRSEFPDATHNCWAFVAGPPGSTAQVGMSDDGEPHGSAGRPMLNALLHADVGEVVMVCTRYYGGVKLGTGGLARAYSGGVVRALEELPTLRKVDRVTVEIGVEYTHVEALRRLLDELDAPVLEEAFGSNVVTTSAPPRRALDTLRTRVADLTQGTGRVEVADD